MAEDSTNKSISSTDSGFPGYLDFETLRSEAIAYLGNLSGNIWTDYNVHDPGITILEVLIYALLDLGYRTNLPAVDLLTKNPADKSADNNFFTPAQILTNNPLTITDFRKLLIDIKGVKNAWLDTENKIPAVFCKREDAAPGEISHRFPAPCDCDYLNGLYHVFVELEKEYDTTDPKQADEYDTIIYKIKCALMAHRNLCEDFIDIKILCKLKIGLCADIELEPDAVGDDVYLKILEALRKFFSPSPTFYTLPQLLEKGKTIDEIFAGRPFDVKESYGFVDTDELGQIELRKKIHLSDVYHVLYDIDGVKNVRNLAWKLCGGTSPPPDVSPWELNLPENFIPEFNVACSGFKFFKYGMQVRLDTSKANAAFNLDSTSNGRIFYKQSSPYLDTEIPGGVYRSDLADYYSIQNEFPHVYGIKKGDLSSTVSDERKAQALQLQGFLLFFDQLLANYLSQLKNIRSLFAFSSSENKEDNHTYFISTLTDVPQLEKLLRFNTGSDGAGNLGTEGTILAYPTSRKNLEDLIASGKIQNTDLDRRCNDQNKDDFPPYQFCYDGSREQAENQLRDDLLSGDFEPVIVANYNDCYFFYCFTSSTDFALISKKYYANAKEAQTAAASIKYLGTFAENYRSFIIDDDPPNEYFSFDLELNLNSYSSYLQLIAENPSLYNTRRQGFLNHLLSRFAEQFTDYALLSSGFLTPQQLQESQIKAEEKFLTNYPDISSNRGKAYDYKCNGWDNKNISGFEKRVKALSGIENWKKHYLCNFVVEKADEIYELSISLFGSAFTVEGKMFTYEAGFSSLYSLYSKLTNNVDFETEYIDHEQKWSVYIKDNFGNKYNSHKLFDTKEQAADYTSTLHSVLSVKPASNENVFVSKFVYRMLFNNYKGETVEESNQKFDTPEDAQKYFKKISSKVTNYLNNSKEFSKIKKGLNLEKVVVVQNENDSSVYIDKNKFQFKPVDVIQLDNVKKKFVLLNDAKTIQFDSLINYDTVKLAEKGFEELLGLLALNENYFVQKENGENTFKIVIKEADVEAAVYFQTFTTEDEAKNKIKEIFDEIISETYHLAISEPLPDNWEFKYQLTNPSGENLEFKTQAAYTSEQQANAAAKQFYDHVSTLKIKKVKKDLQLFLDHKKKIIAHADLTTDSPGEELSSASQLLDYHQELFRAINNPTKKFFDKILAAGKDSTRDQYIYKLVDKDNLLAKASYVSATKADALSHKNDLINAIQAGYDYTSLSFGWDIIDERKDATTNITWYHFLIKCNNVLYQKGAAQGKPLILFESVKGYATKEDAMQAFLDNYLIILRKAFNPGSYGVNQFISLAEILIHEADDCTRGSSTVFVTPETLYEYDGDTAATINAIILLAKSYPIQYISEGRYWFSLFNKNTETYDWRSTSRFDTPQEAMQQFQFFLALLNYSGNLYIEKNETDCRYRIYIREVLALSKLSFATPAQAWGINGVEKFICVAQTENGFHNYLNRKNCDHSFYVACSNTGLIHPCKYETPKRRDNALNKLYQSASFNFFDLLEVDANNNLLLMGLDKKPIANLFIEQDDNRQFDKCERLIEIFEVMYVEANYADRDKNFYLKDAKQRKIATPIEYNTGWSQWKNQLLALACYFPLIKKVNATSDSTSNRRQCNFYIQIKLPGFNSCKDDLANDCPDISSDEDCQPGCYIAWKSDCCFSSCCEALLFYANSLKLISVFSNYKPVYECDCGFYGIELHNEELLNSGEPAKSNNASSIARWLCSNLPDVTGANGDKQNQTGTCFSEIVAINPQRYDNAAIACEAVERAKKLINAEGMHLVEHILLRPRCQNSDHVYDDCNCPYLPGPCIDTPDPNGNNRGNICHFQWKPGGDPDPCAPDIPVCFTPGCDPWSFIATVALPAWPQRFRSKQNRQVIENLLQREAPAHVLLRILWLGPRDFCCFEYYFKNWNYWLAKKMCDPQYTNCNFLGLLFHKNFVPLAECNECVPCSCNDEPPVSCFDDEKEDCPNFDLTTQLNELYCWNKNDYDNYNCENISDRSEMNFVTERNEAAFAVAPDEKAIKPKTTTVKAPAKKVEAATKDKPPVISAREKYLVLQVRSSRYKENVQKIADAKAGNKAAENAFRFLSDVNPDPERYEDLIHKILKNKPDKAKKIKGLTLKEKNVLIENISWQYFDRVCVNEKNSGKITMHEALFNHLRRNKIDMQLLYDDWNPKELEKVEPEINFNEIKKTVT